MTIWLISANEEDYNHQFYFDRDGCIDWEQGSNKYDINDIVYIYSTKSNKIENSGKIKWKTKVEKINIPISESLYPEEFDNSKSNQLVRLTLLKQVNKEELSLENLKENGLSNAPQRPKKLNDIYLLQYIEKYFKWDTTKNMWMVRAGIGKKATLLEKFKRNTVVSFGCGLGDVSDKTEDEIKDIFNAKYPEKSKDSLKVYYSQIIIFRDNIKKGDYVLTYDPSNRTYLIGEVTSDYIFSQDLKTNGISYLGGYNGIREVNWLDEISRDDLKESTKSTLQTPTAVFNIKEEAKEDIFNVLLNDNMWMVRAGEDAFLIDEFLNRNVAVIGWGIGDISEKTEEEIKERLREKYPERTENTFNKWSKIILDFRSKMKEGDYVLTANKKSKMYYLGKFTSNYYFCEKLIEEGIDPYRKYNNFRDVKWLCKVPPIVLSEKANGTLLQPPTSFPIKDKAKEEILYYYKWNSKKRNVIYFGAPGTGKSYNLNSDKGDLFSYEELNSDENEDSIEKNYERVTFHPDYSYANFVGTYKPRPEKDENGNKTGDITYEYVPGPFMRLLVKALKNPSKPFLLIIEEINRANVAAVFGDVFQLLDRDENNESKYDVETTEDMRDYLEEKLGQVYEKIRIPSNMFIWATMNSADQGVFPMDTAFKRRWDFKYYGIDYNEGLIEHIKFNDGNREISWNDLRKAINKELLTYRINEDKLLGPFFAYNEYIDKEEIGDDEFKEIFKNKIIMYLFEDAAKARRNDLFAGAKENDSNVIYSKICEEFDESGIEIFCENITKEFSNEEESES